MKKLLNKKGFTLIELLATMVIMLLVLSAIGVGMDGASRMYEDATFAADSSNLAGILNSALGDILRYSRDIHTTAETTYPYVQQVGADHVFVDSTSARVPDVDFVFTSIEYGIQDAYFYTPIDENDEFLGVLQLKNLRNVKTTELVNAGAYPNLGITDFRITYTLESEDSTTVGGAYFKIEYTIYSLTDPTKTKDVECIVRMLNAE